MSMDFAEIEEKISGCQPNNEELYYITRPRKTVGCSWLTNTDESIWKNQVVESQVVNVIRYYLVALKKWLDARRNQQLMNPIWKNQVVESRSANVIRC